MLSISPEKLANALNKKIVFLCLHFLLSTPCSSCLPVLSFQHLSFSCAVVWTRGFWHGRLLLSCITYQMSCRSNSTFLCASLQLQGLKSHTSPLWSANEHFLYHPGSHVPHVSPENTLDFQSHKHWWGGETGHHSSSFSDTSETEGKRKEPSLKPTQRLRDCTGEQATSTPS